MYYYTVFETTKHSLQATLFLWETCYRCIAMCRCTIYMSITSILFLLIEGFDSGRIRSNLLH
jgi:hypothetical protein